MLSPIGRICGAEEVPAICGVGCGYELGTRKMFRPLAALQDGYTYVEVLFIATVPQA